MRGAPRPRRKWRRRRSAAQRRRPPVTRNLDALTGCRLLVVGDVMLDRYWFGEVSRISPEAPVPVVKVERLEERLGGAANVARNAAVLGGSTTLLSVVGDDEAGRSLSRMLAEAGIDAALQVDRHIDTTVKLRVIGRQQQLLRIDFETTPSHEVLREKLEDFERRVEDCDVVVLSDYGKGGLAHIGDMIRLARAADKPVLVDPKGDDYSKYAGATLITPNRGELRQVVGRWSSEDELAAKAQTLRRRLGLDALLVTRSEEGMTLFRDDEVIHEAARAREVFDVSGAGDTVIATLAILIASGATWDEAIRVANLAAGIVVGKLGTAVVTRQELEAAL
ncbi:MAG: D-glycero-beta-D-manno-heptose-7-phosphate kinase [Azonexus sp.]|nr:D-glycero-beta-D-manno-heptose-7-phosphate kinase [Betaproteobacteria bacterium]MBP6035434.1 D-glycero-beta-D-manno-heptose-7-phosphate kinase [Azonexus sp.]MBP6906442.1 D-glycero-beta-D-manno-heptose-7-phosphate kinase [Azonexus sp.]